MLFRTREFVIGLLPEKGLAAARTSTKTQAYKLLVKYIENLPSSSNNSDDIILELIPALSHKLPKVVAATLLALNQLMAAFGVQVINSKTILQNVPFEKVFNHADKKVREEAMSLAVEIFSFLGDRIKPIITTNMKPVQLKEFEEKVSSITVGSKKPTHLIKSHENAKHKESTQPAHVQDDNEVQEIDAYDFAEPVNIFSRLSPSFYDMVQSDKWKERKEALDTLYEATKVPRIKDDDFTEIIRILARTMKDSNILVVTLGASCIEQLSRGLRKHFDRYRAMVLWSLLERTKEKKASVVEALSNAFYAVFLVSGNIADIVPECLEGTKHKNPQIKTESLKLFSRCLATTKHMPKKEDIKLIAETCIKLLSDTLEAVRSNAAEVLGIIMRLIGERAMAPYLESIDDIRKQKIKEACNNANVVARSGDEKTESLTNHNRSTLALKKTIQRPLSNAEDVAVPSQLGKPMSRTSIRSSLSTRLNGPNPVSSKLERPSSSQSDGDSNKLNYRFSQLNTGIKNSPGKRMMTPPRKASTGLEKPSVNIEAFNAELNILRNEKNEWIKEKQKLLQDLNELQLKNTNLAEKDASHATQVKSYEAQLVRANADVKTLREQLQNYQKIMAQNVELSQFKERAEHAESLLSRHLNMEQQRNRNDQSLLEENKRLRSMIKENSPHASDAESFQLSKRLEDLIEQNNTLMETNSKLQTEVISQNKLKESNVNSFREKHISLPEGKENNEMNTTRGAVENTSQALASQVAATLRERIEQMNRSRKREHIGNPTIATK